MQSAAKLFLVGGALPRRRYGFNPQTIPQPPIFCPVFASRIVAPKPLRRRRGQFLEKIRERLLHARGILDFDARHFQSQNRKTHRHAMVVVGLNLRAVKLRGINRQRVAFLDHLRAALGQFRAQGDDALAFLDAQAAKVGELDRINLTNGASTIAVMMLSPRSVLREISSSAEVSRRILRSSSAIGSPLRSASSPERKLDANNKMPSNLSSICQPDLGQ